MRIRAEDRKIARYLAIIGAIASASIAVLAVLNESDRTRQDYQQQKGYVERNMVLLSFENAVASSDKEMIPAAVLAETKLDLARRQSQLEEMEDGLWLSLSDWAFVGVCVGTGLAGAAGGFCVTWGLCWGLMLAMYMMMRGIYQIIRRKAPAYWQSQIAGQDADGTADAMAGGRIDRDSKRLLPMVIKWMVILTIIAVFLWLALSQNYIPVFG